jgi:hypothetical protein
MLPTCRIKNTSGLAWWIILCVKLFRSSRQFGCRVSWPDVRCVCVEADRVVCWVVVGLSWTRRAWSSRAARRGVACSRAEHVAHGVVAYGRVVSVIRSEITPEKVPCLAPQSLSTVCSSFLLRVHVEFTVSSWRVHHRREWFTDIAYSRREQEMEFLKQRAVWQSPIGQMNHISNMATADNHTTRNKLLLGTQVVLIGD